MKPRSMAQSSISSASLSESERDH
jgi:hypothetical protein